MKCATHITWNSTFWTKYKDMKVWNLWLVSFYDKRRKLMIPVGKAKRIEPIRSQNSTWRRDDRGFNPSQSYIIGKNLVTPKIANPLLYLMGRPRPAVDKNVRRDSHETEKISVPINKEASISNSRSRRDEMLMMNDELGSNGQVIFV